LLIKSHTVAQSKVCAELMKHDKRVQPALKY